MTDSSVHYPIIDDVGSIPLPDSANKIMFEKLYWEAYNAFIKNIDVTRNRAVQRYVINPIEISFKAKINTGLEIVNYPQLMDIHQQFINPIEKYEEEPFLIKSDKAYIVEMKLLEEYAKKYYEQTGEILKVKSCVTGALELYQKLNGYAVYKDMALNLAKSVNRFLKNSIYNEKYIKTAVVSIDEPSIGLVTFTQINNDDVTDILETSAENLDTDVQLHLHSLNSYQLVLNVRDINVLTCEYASDQKNVIPKRDLEEYDKFIRVGISRTNIGGIFGELIEKGENARELNTKQGMFKVIDSKERIKKRYNEALDRYGTRLKYVGPDCGFGGWTYQDVAFKSIKTTVEAVEEIRK
ncbi:MAG: hypothetical protein GF364_11760 [Candidatus Lokiarchaeota archaeon]|nr:hypothetical protein [Candidatus Lokiarchaeota archaeon]